MTILFIMTWHTHVDYCISIRKLPRKASSHLHIIAQLKQSKMLLKDITKVHATLVRPLFEYASPVWYGGLTDQHLNRLHYLNLSQKEQQS